MRRSRVLRTLVAATGVGLLTMFVAAPGGAATAPAKPILFSEVHGEGAWSIFGPLVSWQNELVTAPAYVDLNYTPHGTVLGRQDLVAGKTDFVISGRPFTDEDLAGVKGGAAAFIDAPIQVATLATFVEPPFHRPSAQFTTVQLLCNPDDDTTWPPTFTDPDQCIVRKPYSGPVRIPNRNLAAMFMRFRGTTSPSLMAWNDPDIQRAFGLDPATTAFDFDGNGQTGDASPGFAGRSDADEMTYYLQQFVKQGAPDIWQGIKDADNRVFWDPVTERLPTGLKGGTVTRDGAEQQVDQLAQGGLGVTGVFDPQRSGGVAAAPPAMMRSFHSAFPGQPITFAQIKNASGDWVAPTPDAISKAVDAGGDAPLYALTNPVPDAYPLVWVDHLTVPAHGLSAEKTEALAMLIRYLATTGQEKESAAGEGRLSTALVGQALTAANQVVISNCTGSDRLMMNSPDPGPLAPPTATAMKSIGNMLHCIPVNPTPPTVTTTSSPTTPTTLPTSTVPPGTTDVATQGGNDLTPGGDITNPGTVDQSPGSNVVSTPPADDGSSGGSTPRAIRASLITASQLPMAPPGGATGTDRLAAFLLGVLLYLLFRAPIGRLARRLTT